MPCPACSMRCSTSASSNPAPSSWSSRLRNRSAVRRVAARFRRRRQQQRTAVLDRLTSSSSCIPILRSSARCCAICLSNAIKYTRAGSVELRCERLRSTLRIEVRDTGVGIAPNSCRTSSKSSTRSASRPTARAKATASGFQHRAAHRPIARHEGRREIRSGHGLRIFSGIADRAERRSVARGIRTSIGAQTWAPAALSTCCWSRTNRACAMPCACSSRSRVMTW